jgi:nucleotide-binding universal stress UspA family protein
MKESGGDPAVIVVGVDGSPASRAALRWAAAQAGRTGAALQAVAVWDYQTLHGWGVDAPTDDAAAASGDALARTVRTVLGTDPAIEVRETVAVGHPARVLVELARDAELLVVGSRSHGAVSDALLGSVSAYCTHHAHCPIVVVRPEPATPRAAG